MSGPACPLFGALVEVLSLLGLDLAKHLRTGQRHEASAV
jgi:hypothetical protein